MFKAACMAVAALLLVGHAEAAGLGKDQACFNDPACRDAKAAQAQQQADAREQEHRDQLAAQARDEAALRARCKGDLNSPRIGMPAARALACTEGLELVTEETTARGVVRTYGDGSNFLRVQGGKVVAVGRY